MSKKVLVPLADGFEEIEFVSIVDTLRRADIEVLIAGVRDSGTSGGGASDSNSAGSANGASDLKASSPSAHTPNAKDSQYSAGEIYTGAHGILIHADTALESLDSSALAGFDGVALAGGWQGMLNFKASQKLRTLLREFKARGKLVSAICASPIVLDAAGVLGGKFACYPSCEKFAYEDNSTQNTKHTNTEAKNVTSTIGKTAEKPLNGQYQPNASVVREGNLITAAGPATGVLFALEIIAYLLGEAQSQSIASQMLIPYLNHHAEILRS